MRDDWSALPTTYRCKMKLLGALHLNMPTSAYLTYLTYIPACLPACLSTYSPTALDTHLGEVAILP